MTTTIVIKGQPFAKQRPRWNTKTGRTYTPGKTLKYEALVADEASLAFVRPIEGPVSVSIEANFAMAPSWSKKRKAEMLGRFHTQTPDLDNVQKAILDGLNGVAFDDDKQVARIQCVKVWVADNPHVAVTVRAL